MTPRHLAFLLAGAAAPAIAAPERGIEIQAGSSLTYDDNVFRAPDGVTRPGGTRSDWVVAPYLTARLAAPAGPFQLGLDSNVSYRFHRRNERLDRERISASGKAETRLLGCGLELGGSFLRAQSDLADILGGTSLVNVENRTVLRGDALCGGEIGLRPGFGYSRTQVDNSSDERSASDYSADQFTASLGYSRPALGLVSLYGSYRDGRYPNRPPLVPGGEANDRVRVYSAGVSLSRAIGSRLGGRASIGYMKVRPRLEIVPDYSGISYAAELNFKGSDRLSGEIGISRSAQQSNLLDVNYSITTLYEASARYALTPFMSLTANAGWQKRRFTPSAVTPTLVTGADRLTRLGLGLSYRLGQRIELGLSGLHHRRAADLAALRYKANSVSVSAGLNF